MGYNSVATPLMTIERPITFDTIVRAMACKSEYTQKHSYSITLNYIAAPQEGGIDYVEVVLVNTVILRYWSDARIEVNAGNFYTKFTRMYLNDWLKGVAYIEANGRNPWTLYYNGTAYDFFNNMIINTTTKKIEGIGLDFEAIKRHNVEIDKAIEKWWKCFEPSDLSDLVRYDAGFRCDECDDYGEEDTQHLLRHIKNNEYVGAMFRRAFLDMEQTQSYLETIAYYMHKREEIDHYFRRVITRWLRRRLYTGPITF